MFRQIASTMGKLLEVDWTSLFDNVFSMVRMRIACKDATKIPSKRLFEMKNSLYVIQFKVDKRGENGSGPIDNRGGGDDKMENEEDNGMEVLDHDNVDENAEVAKESDGGREKSSMGSRHRGGASSGKNVACWASLFQDDEGTKVLEDNEIGQYSCVKLLRDMEALEV
jgi:hypothetical protein